MMQVVQAGEITEQRQRQRHGGGGGGARAAMQMRADREPDTSQQV